jgi:hypothetical protein
MNKTISVFFFVFYTLLQSQSALQVVFVAKGPNLDCVVDEPVWQKAVKVDQFFQREPRLNEPVSEKTEVLICCDADYLYFGFHCYHQNNSDITAKEMGRDVSLGNDDRVQIILDTFMDHTTGYWFQIGPRGSIGDALVSENGAGLNKEWDCLFKGKARIHSRGWDAEVAVPWKSITFKPGLDQWGLKLIRNIVKNHEASYWPTANLDSYRFQVSDAGLLTGLKNIHPGHGLDISPYGLLGLDQKINTDSDSKRDAGVDIFYQVTPALKTAVTVNTDFAQTEVDTRQINLSRFPLFFPEKRNFFLDGAEYFTFALSGDNENKYSQQIIPFFSRRLGLDAAGNPIAIVYGGKLTGQIGKTYIGLMNILDKGDGRNRNFSVLRLRQPLGRQSSIGFITTYGNALSRDNNYLYGMDVKLASSTFHDNKNIALQFYGLASETENQHGRDGTMGIELAYPNDHLSIRTGAFQIEKNFHPGMGFVPRSDIRTSYLNVTVSKRTNRFRLLQILVRSGIDYITDLRNRLLTRQFSVTPATLRFKSWDEASLSVTSQYEYLAAPFTIHPQHMIPAGIYQFTRVTGQFVSAQRRPFWFSAGLEGGSFYTGSRQDLRIALGYKVNVPLYVGVEWEHHKVSLADGDFITTVSRLNLNLLFSPNMTLYNYLQYDNLSKNAGWQSRFRWILTPGNEIYLTWNSKWYEPGWDHLQAGESAARFKVRYNYRF